MKRKIGIMGGTFDPIHNGHLALGEEAYRQFSLDEVVFMPTGIPPHKAGKKIADAGDRNYMVEAAVAATPYFSCSDMELRRHRTTYTAETLTAASGQRIQETEYYYIVGAVLWSRWMDGIIRRSYFRMRSYWPAMRPGRRRRKSFQCKGNAGEQVRRIHLSAEGSDHAGVFQSDPGVYPGRRIGRGVSAAAGVGIYKRKEIILLSIEFRR